MNAKYNDLNEIWLSNSMFGSFCSTVLSRAKSCLHCHGKLGYLYEWENKVKPINHVVSLYNMFSSVIFIYRRYDPELSYTLDFLSLNMLSSSVVNGWLSGWTKKSQIFSWLCSIPTPPWLGNSPYVGQAILSCGFPTAQEIISGVPAIEHDFLFGNVTTGHEFLYGSFLIEPTCKCWLALPFQFSTYFASRASCLLGLSRRVAPLIAHTSQLFLCWLN